MVEQIRADQLMDRADPITGWIPPIECASGFVRSISYNIFDKQLRIEINVKLSTKEWTAKYSYFNFPLELFVEFVNSTSKGSWYNTWVKTYKYRME
jgi:hypothetical protein